MSDAAKLAKLSFMKKPQGTPFSSFGPSVGEILAIGATLEDAVIGSAYAAIISYGEAMYALQHGSISWSVVRLYYSCFYSIRALLLIHEVVPFSSGNQMMLNIPRCKFLKGGSSSHHWNWAEIKKIGQLDKQWFFSSDSQEAYGKLREHRENVNYTHVFTDPAFHNCLVSSESDLVKRFRVYRDDDEFLYTYLDEHLAIAYPTKLVFELDVSLRHASISLPQESLSHAKKIWRMKDRCPCS